MRSYTLPTFSLAAVTQAQMQSAQALCKIYKNKHVLNQTFKFLNRGTAATFQQTQVACSGHSYILPTPGPVVIAQTQMQSGQNLCNFSGLNTR